MTGDTPNGQLTRELRSYVVRLLGVLWAILAAVLVWLTLDHLTLKHEMRSQIRVIEVVEKLREQVYQATRERDELRFKLRALEKQVTPEE